MEKKMFLWVFALYLLGFALSSLSSLSVSVADARELILQGYSGELLSIYSYSSPISLSAPIEWNITLGGTDSDGFYSVQQTSDGGYVAAGYTESFGAGRADCWLVKVDRFGEVEWNKTYGKTELDCAYSVQQTNDGGFILVGEINAGLLDCDFLLIKTDSYGEMEWNRTYGGSSWDIAYSVQQSSDGGYIACGYTCSFGAGEEDYWLIKTDEFGMMEWNKTYGGGDRDQAYEVQQTSDGGYVVVGSADSYKTSVFAGEIWIVKTDEFGEVEWNRISGWPDWDFAHSVIQTSDGGYIIGGTRFSSYETRYDFWLIKLDSNGTYMWDKVYARPGAKEDSIECVRQIVDGGFIVAGGWDFWLVKTDEFGEVEWNRTFGGASEFAFSVQQTGDGGYVVAGDTESFGFGQSGYPDGWLVKFFPGHDVAVCGVEPSKAVVGGGFSLSVNISVCNPGFFTESFNVTCYMNGSCVGSQVVCDLGSEVSASLVFALNVSGFSLGNYTLSAYAEPVLDEMKTADNLFVGGQLFVTVAGDVDADCDVDIFDIVVMVGAYGSEESDPKYNSIYDINDDSNVNIFDIVIAAQNYGENWV